MQATISPTTASKPCVLAAARSLRPKQQCATASLSRPTISSRGVARSTIPQRKAASRPAGRRQAMVLAAGGDALVVGSSGQTAARIVVSLLRAGVKVTAGTFAAQTCLLPVSGACFSISSSLSALTHA
jgi:hypothetical protein